MLWGVIEFVHFGVWPFTLSAKVTSFCLGLRSNCGRLYCFALNGRHQAIRNLATVWLHRFGIRFRPGHTTTTCRHSALWLWRVTVHVTCTTSISVRKLFDSSVEHIHVHYQKDNYYKRNRDHDHHWYGDASKSCKDS